MQFVSQSGQHTSPVNQILFYSIMLCLRNLPNIVQSHFYLFPTCHKDKFKLIVLTSVHRKFFASLHLHWGNQDYKESFVAVRYPVSWNGPSLFAYLQWESQALIHGALHSLKNVISNEIIDLIKNKICQTISEFLDNALQLDKAYLDSEKKALAMCELWLNLKPEMWVISIVMTGTIFIR